MFQNVYNKPPNILVYIIGLILLYGGLLLSIALATYNLYLLIWRDDITIDSTHYTRAWGLWIISLLISIIGFGLKRASNYDYANMNEPGQIQTPRVNKYGEQI